MLAVSGTHLVFAVVAIVHALTFLLARVERLAARWVVARFASCVGLVLSLIYADFAGGSSSAWRAAFMLSVAFSARALGRKPLTVRTFGCPAWSLPVLDPLCRVRSVVHALGGRDFGFDLAWPAAVRAL